MDQSAATTSQPVTSRPSKRLVVALAAVSFSTLLLELSLTRLFSVVLFYHFAFLAVSLALLGLGAGGVFAHLRHQSLAAIQTDHLCSILSLVNAIAVLFGLMIVLRLPVSLALSIGNLAKLTAIYVICAVPFFVTGIIFSTVFARNTEQIGKLYAADLAGGAMACLLLVPALNFLGAPTAVILAALIMLLAAWFWSPGRKSIGFLALAFALLIVVNVQTGWIDVIYAKGQRLSKPEFARWNAISRIQVNNSSLHDDIEQVDNRAPVKVISIDADANTFVMTADPHAWSADYEETLMSRAPSIVNVLRPRGTFAIIGPGGGVDVLRAVANGSPSVTGIEINPIIADDLMRSRFADYSHNLYGIPEVHINVRDGRSFIRSSRDKYDVVQMTLVDTWASTAAGAFALSENNLYTKEAFQEYFQHLNPDGILAVTRWEFRQPREALRVVSEAMAALRAVGVSDFRRHVIVVSDGELNRDGRPVTVLVKRSEFTPEDEDEIRAHLRAHPNLVPIYLPTENEADLKRPGSREFLALIEGGDPAHYSAEYAFNVAPVTDNQPFFFFTLKLSNIFHPARAGKGLDWKVNMGVLVLFALLAISTLAVLAFLIVPLALAGGARGVEKLPLLYFVAIGLGYILIEMVLIQRFVLFLGHPTYAITVVVFLMLLASGLGSLTSQSWMRTEARWRTVIIAIVGVSAAYCFVLPLLLTPLVGLSTGIKLMLSALLIAPLAFLMGMPFPTGLRALARTPGGSVEWAWAMNAAASVLGSALAIVIALQFGLTVVLLTAAAVYALSAVLSISLKWRSHDLQGKLTPVDATPYRVRRA